MQDLRRLWRGDMPLPEAFWTWAVLVGIVVNLISSFLFLICIMMDQTLLALVLGYGLSVPYNVLAVVGVWRAADRDGTGRGDVFKIATLVLMVLLSVT